MVRLFTDAELAEKCSVHRPIPMYLQKAILDPPKSIRNNVYKDIHRTYEPNYQAPVSVIDMALNAQSLYGVSARSYIGVYNKLVDKEIKKNRKELDRDLEEMPVDEYAPGYYYDNHGVKHETPVEEHALGYYYDKHGVMHETLEDYIIRQELRLDKDIHSKGISADADTQTQIYTRPRGQAPKGKRWDVVLGSWVDKDKIDTQVEVMQSGVVDTIVEQLRELPFYEE